MIQLFRAFALSAVLFSALTGFAAAEKTTFVVSDSAGKPVKDAVVMVAGTSAGPIKFAWPMQMKQQDLTFDPFVLIVPVGAEVEFPNLDRVRHHVYSFSKGNKFELKLYGKEEARAVTLEKAGIVAIGCNIHDEMVAYIRVVDTPYAAKTGADGTVTLDLPAGATTATVWHPNALPAEVKVALPAKRTAPVPVTLKVKAHAH